ncbi:MAG: excinuclease ABC subunit UvrA, partial [Prevotella sp.]|nr:excinuclease ABC subunit UvrA [Prevotella sp.]
YIKLGQSSTTLSGGESQRVKLATELAKRDTGRTLYILDEPTTGLHFEDINILMQVLNRLVDKGNTVIIIEHNLDVIRLADHLIDMGPEGGRNGGNVLSTGTPEEIARSRKGYTPQFVRNELKLKK